jgi:cell division protein FtsB
MPHLYRTTLPRKRPSLPRFTAVALALVLLATTGGGADHTQAQNTPPYDAQIARLQAELAALAKTNRELVAELDTLKTELLKLAVQSATTRPAPPPDPAPDSPARWALGVSYETALSFLALHSEPTAITSTAHAGNLVITVGAIPANGQQVRIVHDRSKERVYSIALVVSLAADAPKPTSAENRQLVAAFLKAFAPALKDADAVTGAIAQLASSDATRRLVFLADDAKVTIWNHKGTYTFRAESVRSELE